MDSSQIPRTPDDPDVGRGTPMQRQSPGPPPNCQPRPQGPPGPQGLQVQPAGPPRYPINNNGPQPLNRLDSKTSLNSPTGQPNQFTQPRPQFGPPRPQSGQPPPPGGYPRGPPPQNNPGLQGPRFPPPGSAPGIRGPPPGQRPPININQQQQQIRIQRPELVGPQSQIRFAPQPYNPENRPLTPRIIPDTAPNYNPVSTPRDFTSERKPPIYPQSREKMETEGVNVPVLDGNSDGSVNSKKRATSRNVDVMDDDDDDVVMDSERNPKSPSPEKRPESALSKSSVSPNPPPQTPTSESRASPASLKHEITASQSPKESRNSTPAPIGDQRLKSRLSESAKSPELENLTIKSPIQNNENEIVDDKSRTSSAKSIRSPTKSSGQTPDFLDTSPGVKSPGVVGFDNGKPRSLSPKSPTTPVSSPVPLNPSKVPENLKLEAEKKKATFAEDVDIHGGKDAHEDKLSRPGTPGLVKEKPPTPTKSPSRPQTPVSSMKRSTSGRSIKADAGNESGGNQTAVGKILTPKTNGVALSPTKKQPPKSKDGEKPKTVGSPLKSPTKSVRSMPRTPEAGPPASTADKKKVPMNKVQVGAAPSPNLKTVRSKIGSLENASYKPGGGRVKIENRKLDFSNAQPKIAAKNDKYAPSGGEKKIPQVKLQWNAKPKVGSLANATYKPGGGDKKIETVKLDFKDKAKPKVGSKENAKHVPGGGTVKTEATTPKTPQDSPSNIETQKIDIKAESKIGSLDNVKHKPGGGDKKIFNDKDYLRQTSSNAESVNGSGRQSPVPSNINESKNGMPASDENLNQEY